MGMNCGVIVENKQAWFAEDMECIICGWPVVVCESNFKYDDYLWYCSNKLCSNHADGTNTADLDPPFWARRSIDDGK